MFGPDFGFGVQGFGDTMHDSISQLSMVFPELCLNDLIRINSLKSPKPVDRQENRPARVNARLTTK
jgi:hypothetical protein